MQGRFRVLDQNARENVSKTTTWPPCSRNSRAPTASFSRSRFISHPCQVPWKIFMDRLIPLAAWPSDPAENSRASFAMVSSCGFYEIENFDLAVSFLKSFCKGSGLDFAGALLRPHANALRPMLDARRAGRRCDRSRTRRRPSICVERLYPRRLAENCRTSPYVERSIRSNTEAAFRGNVGEIGLIMEEPELGSSGHCLRIWQSNNRCKFWSYRGSTEPLISIRVQFADTGWDKAGSR